MSTPASSGPGPEDPITAERKIASKILEILDGLGSLIPDAALQSLDPIRITASIPWDQVGERLMVLSEPLQHVIVAAAREEMPAGALRKDVDGALPIEFALINELAVNYAEQHAGRLVLEISDKLRVMIADLIASNVAGLLPRDVLLKLLIDLIPLHSAWAQSVAKATAREYEVAIQSGMSLAEAMKVAEKIGYNRARALAQSRAQNIARTEAMTAMNEGRLASWHQQVANGWMLADSVKEWVEGRDPCDLCAPYVGELVPWDQPFSNGKMMPPLHPRCRCTAAALPPDADILARMAAQRGSG